MVETRGQTRRCVAKTSLLDARSIIHLTRDHSSFLRPHAEGKERLELRVFDSSATAADCCCCICIRLEAPRGISQRTVVVTVCVNSSARYRFLNEGKLSQPSRPGHTSQLPSRRPPLLQQTLPHSPAAGPPSCAHTRETRAGSREGENTDSGRRERERERERGGRRRREKGRREGGKQPKYKQGNKQCRARRREERECESEDAVHQSMREGGA